MKLQKEGVSEIAKSRGKRREALARTTGRRWLCYCTRWERQSNVEHGFVAGGGYGELLASALICPCDRGGKVVHSVYKSESSGEGSGRRSEVVIVVSRKIIRERMRPESIICPTILPQNRSL